MKIEKKGESRFQKDAMPKKFFFTLTFSLFAASAFSEVTVVNPAEGAFSNPQTLVIESNGGEEIYYSFSGSDPLSQGFAYDGPVLLEVTGNVELRIATIDKSLKKSEKRIRYSVSPAKTLNAEHSAFLSEFEKAPVFEYVAGEKIAIPFTMTYAFGQSRSFEKGREISVSKNAAVERYVPVSFRCEEGEWRFVIHVTSQNVGRLSQRKVPFEIENWTKLKFTDPRMIYSLDGEWWHSSSEVLDLDRSVANTVCFQSADYSSENPVTKVTLPPKPALKVEPQHGGGVTISFEEDAFQKGGGYEYKLSASPLSKTQVVSQGLFSEIFLDVFSGERLSDTLALDVFSDGVFQGTLFASLSLNRETPAPPKIRTSAASFYSRENVSVAAESEKNLALYAGVCAAVEVPVFFEASDLQKIEFEDPVFSPYDGNAITLFADTEKILAYKICFYAENSLGTKSETSSYSVIVDKYNYYVDSSFEGEGGEGTPFSPFKDLSQFPKIARENEFSRFCVRGEVQMKSGEVSVASNVEFVGQKDAKIILAENTAILLKNAGLFSKGVIWEKASARSPKKKSRGEAKALTNIFILENSAATFLGCEILGSFSGDGVALNLSSSALSLEKSIVVNNSQGYAAAVSAIDSKIKIADSRFLCVSDTAVSLSLNSGQIEMSDTFVQVTARMARIAEFIDAKVSLLKNKFKAELSSASDEKNLVYKTVGTVILKDEGNVFQ